jgi:hypothetical protein
MSEEAILERARRARALLEEETVMEAFAFIAERLTQEWRHTTTAQAQHREALHAQIAGLDALKAQLAAWIDQAKVIEIKREREAQRQAKPFRVIGR